MSASFYFYDLETSGFNPREARIMQFAGQRTDMNLKPVGDPHNILIKLTDDVVPDPGAILVTGITPQKTKAEGITEAEFLKTFINEVATPDTIFLGFNTVRFDDEFMRYLLYRNFYDAYEWQWKDGRSRWDLLDVVRMTRALRPEGIQWPVDSEGKPGNRLESLAKLNKLTHANAHDALSDVEATIDLARLLKAKQPKLFDFLLSVRDKKKAAELVNGGQPFVYTSGKYASEFEKTTVVTKLCDHPKKQGILVYDLRTDPDDFITLSPEKIVECWTRRYGEEGLRLPVKTLQFNRCPAIAPLGVLDDASQKRIGITLKAVEDNRAKLTGHPEFIKNVLKALEMLDKKQQSRLLEDEQSVDSRLYEKFIGDKDKKDMQKVRDADGETFDNLQLNFSDERLNSLLPLYKARNFPKYLSDEERAAWELHCKQKLTGTSRLKHYFELISELQNQKGLNDNQRYLLEELILYGESVIPDPA